MQNHPDHNITSKRAIGLLHNDKILSDLYIAGAIQIVGEDQWEKEITISNCVVENFGAMATTFTQPVKFTNTHFKNCSFTFCFFLKGLIIENCTFDSYLDLQAGGHSQIGYPIIIKNNQFSGFVNFFDCWYMTDVFVTDNTFSKGTNIESKNQYVSFDIPPIILNNIGQMNIESENPE